MRPPRLPLFRSLLALAALLPLGVGACQCEPAWNPPPHAFFTLTSGDTVVEVDRRTLDIVVRRTGNGPIIGRLDTAGCAPVALALRPLDDEGSRYHDPEAPGAGLAWYRLQSTRLLEVEWTGEGPDARSATLGLTLGRDDEDQTYAATVTLAPGPQGFVDVDITVDAPPRAVAMLETCLPLDEDTHVVGGGERFGGVDLRGRVIPLAFRAPGPFASSTNESHAPIPWLATTAGLGLLVETERVGAFDVGATDPEQLVARFHGRQLPLRVRAGDIEDNVAAHNRRMGLPPMPPRWALAPQQWRNEHELTLDEGGDVVSDGRDRFLDDAETMRALDLPNTTMWIDAPWSTGYNTFTFNELQFPDAPSMIKEAEARGYRVIVWATEHLNSSDDSMQQPGMPPYGSLGLHHAFDQAGYLVQTESGAPFTFSWPRGFGGFVDFSNPAAVSAWQDQVRPLLELGIRGFKLDYGETMRADLLGTLSNDVPVFADGSTTAVMHTRYARLYHEAFLGVLEEVHPQDHFIITRTGGLYDQKNGMALWPGDLENDFSRAGDLTDEGELSVGGLPAAISGALSLSMSGYPLYGSDIGGYRGGTPTTEVLLRWAQFGAVSTIMQLGGGGTGDATHNPWDERYDTEVAVPVYRRYARLHMDLVPYLEQLLVEATTTGAPPLIPLGVASPQHEEAWADPDAFLVGPDLAAFPVVEPGATERDIFLPEGTWLDWWTGEQLEGPGSFTVAAPLEVMPLFQRAGSPLPLSDPRLETLVASEDEEDFDPEDERALYVVRATAGPDAEVELADGTVLSQHTVGEGTTVLASAPEARTWLIEIVVRDDEVGPWGRAPIRTGIATTVGVPTWQDLLQCLPPCTHTDEENGRLYAKLTGDEVGVTFGDPPPEEDAAP